MAFEAEENLRHERHDATNATREEEGFVSEAERFPHLLEREGQRAKHEVRIQPEHSVAETPELAVGPSSHDTS